MNVDCSNVVLSEEYADYIVGHDLLHRLELSDVNLCYNIINDTYVSVYVPINSLPDSVLNSYGYRIYPRLFGLMDNRSIEKSGVRRLRNIPGLDLLGQGVLIGIVDTGIDYTHSAFLNADGTSKILSIWDQSIQTGNTPVGLNYGTVYTRDEINEALQNADPLSVVPTTDDIGHGTFLAGIAAGNISRENDFSGVVPDAEIVAVKLKPAKQNFRDLYLIKEGAICYQENDIMLGVRYLIETAILNQRPLSICIGLGTSQGAHDGLGSLDNYLSSISLLDGISASIAAGNEGASRGHFESILGSNTTSDTIELNVGEGEMGFIMEIWGDFPNTFSIDLVSPGGEYVPRIYPRIGEQRLVTFIFERTRINIFFQIAGVRSGAQLVILKFSEPSEGIWRINVYKSEENLDLKINSWLPIREFINENTFFIRPQVYTTLTSPANAPIPITATAYDAANESIYINASRGFNRVFRFTPSLAAPGVNVIGPSPGNTYVVSSGTSIAAAHTAGIAAILLEWGKVRGNLQYMDGIDVKNLLLRGAERSPSLVYPNRIWGFGRLNIYETFESLRGNV